MKYVPFFRDLCLPTPEVGEHTVDHIDKHTCEYDNEGTASIHVYLLFSGIITSSRFPRMGNNSIENVVHSLPFTERAKDTGDSGNESQSEKGIKPEV